MHGGPNEKIALFAFVCLITLMTRAVLFALATLSLQLPLMADLPTAEIAALKEEIARQKLILSALESRLATLEGSPTVTCSHASSEPSTSAVSEVEGLDAPKTAPDEASEVVTIRIQPGEMAVDGKGIAPHELADVLAKLDDQIRIVVAADRATPFKHVQQVLSQCAEAGLVNVVFRSTTSETDK